MIVLSWLPGVLPSRRQSVGTRTLCVALCAAASLWAWAAGSLSGTVRDPSGAVVPHARLTLTNATLGGEFKANTDPQGLYTFPAVPVGRYNLTIAAEGFRAQQRNNIAIDTDAAMRVDVALSLTQQTDQVTVSATPEALSVQVETVSTHLGDVVAGAQIAALPLNGRSYTDLLAIQPGVTPVSTLTPTSVIMAGVTGTINPSGDLNPGDVSINGQRESANGFTMNGIDVQEHMNGGTSVIPNLDSIEEFRVLTNNFDAE